jgi:TDG/mug DNA glycosylase family protein
MSGELPTRKPSREQLAAARDQTVPDVLASDLGVVFVGINPSLYSAAVGHHFARPGNRFWPALHAAGFTDRLLSPFEDRQLPRWGCGLTNLVARATATADELDAHELRSGARRLVRKLRKYRPRWVAFLGVTAYRTAFGLPGVPPGPREELLAGCGVWVLPNPSGLNAHYQLRDLARLYARLRQAFRGERQPTG